MLFRQHQILAVAVMASLSLSACGQKKDLYNDKAPANTAAQTQKSKETTLSNSQPGLGGGLGSTDSGKVESAPDLGGGVGNLPQPPKPSDSSSGSDSAPTTASNAPTAPKPTPRPSSPPVQTSPPTRTTPAPSVNDNNSPRPLPAPPVVDVAPVEQVPTETNTVPDYDPSSPENAGDFAKRLTGGVTQDGLVYTSSSTDRLIDFLRLQAQSDSGRRGNQAASAAVVSATLSKQDDAAVISVKILEGNSIRTYNVAGALTSERSAKLRGIKSGPAGATTGTSSTSGTLKCLDLDGGCDNILMRLQLGNGSEGAKIQVVFRQSDSDLHFELPTDVSNPEYLTLRELAVNTIKRNNTSNRIMQAKISSWEVVDGRSGFAVTMKSGESQLLGFAGPLLAPEEGSRVNIAVSRLAKDKDDTLSDLADDNTRLDLQNTIGEARMIANNGLGQVTLKLKMRQRANSNKEQFSVTFMRTIKPLVDLDEDIFE